MKIIDEVGPISDELFKRLVPLKSEKSIIYISTDPHNWIRKEFEKKPCPSE